MSNLMAILLQGLASKLGIVTGRDLAQACRDHYSPPVGVRAVGRCCEIAIAACDLAEVIGTAIALNLLFGIPLALGRRRSPRSTCCSCCYLQNKGFRLLEALVIALVATVGVCFLFELILAKPDVGARGARVHPDAADPRAIRTMLYIAIGILGATVMPHNLYLHSSIVQTRKYEETTAGKREAVKFAFIDSTDRALVRAVHQRRDPDRRRGDVPHDGQHAGRRDPGCLPAADAAARRRRGEHGVRAGAAGVAGRTRRSPARSPARS